MLVNLDSISAWALVGVEAIALGVLGVTFWLIVKPHLRRRIPGAIAVVAALSLVQAEIQERGWRVAVWLVAVVSLTFALSAIGKRGTVYAEYWEIEEKYGKKSAEMNSYVIKIVARTVAILLVLLVVSAFLIKGAYSQGT